MGKFILPIMLLLSNHALACVFCNRQVREGIYNDDFLPNLVTLLSAFIVLGAIVVFLWIVSVRRDRLSKKLNYRQGLSPVPMTTAAVVLGIGLGGFIDGIVLHQILQWHEMLSNRITPTNYIGKSINMFWDGIFHAFCAVVTIIGLYLMWRVAVRADVDKSGHLFIGGMLLGWGTFNMVEGVINHHLLKLHNVVEAAADPDPGNYTFLGFSILLLILGIVICKRKRNRLHSDASPR